MPETRGLMAFWARVDDDYVARFRAWHTSERGIHGGGPGEERYLLLVETGAPDPLEAISDIEWLGNDAVGMRDAYGIDYALEDAPATP